MDSKDLKNPKILRKYIDEFGEDLVKTQVSLEAKSRSIGYQRYIANHDRLEDVGEFSQSPAGTNVVNAFDRLVTEELQAWMEKADRPGKRHSALAMCKDEYLDVETIAFLGTKAIVNTVAMRGREDKLTRTALAFAIAERIHDELRLRWFRDNKFMMLKRLLRTAKDRGLPRHRTKDLIQSQFRREELVWRHKDWSADKCLKLGLMFLEVFQNATGLLEIVDTYGKKGKAREKMVHATDELVKQVTERIENSALRENFWMPMVVPPIPWSQDHLIGGPYLTNHVTPFPLIKRSKKGYLYDASHSDFSAVLKSVNAVQDTPWHVNSWMLEAAKWAFDADQDFAGLCRSGDRPVPPVTPEAEADPDGEGGKAYRRACWETHQANRKARSERYQVLQAFRMAEDYAKFDKIYYAWDLDSRGRMYPKTSALSPQGSDLHKGILEFGTATPITSEEQVAWLYIHTANCAGQDKLLMQDRIAWVEDNLERIIATGEDYRSDLWWATDLADEEPWQFLRACREIYLLHEHGGEGFMTTLPVAVDATCSGLQHYSAMTRDRRGAESVNLCALDERRDIYGEVAERTRAKFEVMAKGEGEEADMALAALDFGITRSICKRPTMIQPYSGTLRACEEYTDDFVREAIEKGTPAPWHNRTQFSRFVAKYIWASIAEIVVKAREAMDYLTKCASASVKTDRTAPVQWRTPDGFVVQVDEPESVMKRVTTTLDGRQLDVRYRELGQQQDIRAVRNCTPPNFVHSMDATHCRMTVLDFLEKVQSWDGYCPSFALVHDSFAVHATVMPLFAETIRGAFRRMYEENDVLAQFAETVREVVGQDADLPELPEYGSYDLTEVEESVFFFS